MKTIDIDGMTTDERRELEEGTAMSCIIDNTIGWLERRCSELHDVREEREFAGRDGNPFRKDDLARAVRYARECAEGYGFGHHADDGEIFDDCKREYEASSKMIDELRTAGNDGEREVMRSVLHDCRKRFGKPLGDHWAKMYDTDDLCGWNSVEELIGCC